MNRPIAMTTPIAKAAASAGGFMPSPPSGLTSTGVGVPPSVHAALDDEPEGHRRADREDATEQAEHELPRAARRDLSRRSEGHEERNFLRGGEDEGVRSDLEGRGGARGEGRIRRGRAVRRRIQLRLADRLADPEPLDRGVAPGLLRPRGEEARGPAPRHAGAERGGLLVVAVGDVEPCATGEHADGAAHVADPEADRAVLLEDVTAVVVVGLLRDPRSVVDTGLALER